MSEKAAVIKGHGHVTPNADGSRTRCGGPTICKVCKAELEAQQTRAVDYLAVINKAYMALTGYLPGHRNAITDEAIEACRSALKSSPVSAGVVDERAAFQEWYATPEAFKAGDSNGWSGIAWAAWQKRAALSAPSHGEQVRKGWRLVPFEPNEAIRDAINLLCDDHSAFEDSDAFWSYLLAATPSAGSQEQE